MNTNNNKTIDFRIRKTLPIPNPFLVDHQYKGKNIQNTIYLPRNQKQIIQVYQMPNKYVHDNQTNPTGLHINCQEQKEKKELVRNKVVQKFK